MTTMQFALFFTAILVAYVLVHLRLARFERYVREISRLEQLTERLDRVFEVLEGVRLDRIEDRLDRLHDDLHALIEAQRGLVKGLERTRTETHATTTPASDRVHAAVESRLLALGYSELRIVSDLSGASLEGECVVQVECSKQNMVSKGTVTTRNGSVVDVALRPVAQLFP